jgi:hypothetical protein
LARAAWERHFFENALEKGNRVSGAAARDEAEHAVSRAIVDRDVVVQAGRDLTNVHLDSVTRDRTVVALRSFDTESTRPAQIEDQCNGFRPGFLPRRAVRTATVAEQPGNALRLIARQPLAQRRTLDAAAATDQAGIPLVVVQPNPNQASTLCRCYNVVGHGQRSILIRVKGCLRIPQLFLMTWRDGQRDPCDPRLVRNPRIRVPFTNKRSVKSASR